MEVELAAAVDAGMGRQALCEEEHTSLVVVARATRVGRLLASSAPLSAGPVSRRKGEEAAAVVVATATSVVVATAVVVVAAVVVGGGATEEAAAVVAAISNARLTPAASAGETGAVEVGRRGNPVTETGLARAAKQITLEAAAPASSAKPRVFKSGIFLKNGRIFRYFDFAG
jgi:hypothetical protein